MKRRSIEFVEAYNAQLITEEVPEPKGNEVVIKLAVSTISSGTEGANLVGNPSVWASRKCDTVAHFPRRCGYSSSGRVVEAGSDAKNLKVGDRVAAFWTTHSEYCVIPENKAIKIDDNVSFNEASLWHIATFPMAAIRKCRLEMGESAIVMGQGVLGLMAVKLLVASGAAPVIAVDPLPEKRELALKTGADFAFDPFDKDFEKNVRTACGGGVKVAIEVTGNGKALDMVLDCMAPLGRVSLLGCTRESDFTIDYYKKVHDPGISLIGAHTMARPDIESSPGLWTTYDDMVAISKLVKYGRLEFSSLIAEIHSPEEAHEVFTRLANEKAFPVVQFDWSRLG
ncbi:MAG: zinc-binding alcohol dehydrogenase [Monoglobales bacterium]